MKSSADISACGMYRYRLTRGEGRLMPVVMLNPSTADADEDDATIRRLLGFAQRGVRTCNGGPIHRYDGIDVVNLCAYRSTDPRVLKTVDDPYGPLQANYHHDFCKKYQDEIIVAWGANATAEAELRFMRVLANYIHVSHLVCCFGTTKNNKPKHPLYLPNNTMLHKFFYD